MFITSDIIIIIAILIACNIQGVLWIFFKYIAITGEKTLVSADIRLIDISANLKHCVWEHAM